VGCIAETLRRAGRRPISLYNSLGFFVFAPAKQIEDGVFSKQMTKEGIRRRLLQRVQMYESESNHTELQKWLDEWALPLVERMELSCCPWESVIDRVSVTYPDYGASLCEFYKLCLKYNAGAGTTGA